MFHILRKEFYHIMIIAAMFLFKSYILFWN